MKTCLLILVSITLVYAAQFNFPEYDEDYEDAKDRLIQKTKPKQEVQEKRVIYDLAEAPKLFEKFIKDYDRKYKDEAEYKRRYEIFVKTLKEINRVNSSGASFTSDINLFADADEHDLSVIGGVPDDLE